MSDAEQVARFVADLQRLIQLYKVEYDLTVAAAIGGLEIVKLDLWKEQTDLQ